MRWTFAGGVSTIRYLPKAVRTAGHGVGRLSQSDSVVLLIRMWGRHVDTLASVSWQRAQRGGEGFTTPSGPTKTLHSIETLGWSIACFRYECAVRMIKIVPHHPIHPWNSLAQVVEFRVVAGVEYARFNPDLREKGDGELSPTS